MQMPHGLPSRRGEQFGDAGPAERVRTGRIEVELVLAYDIFLLLSHKNLIELRRFSFSL
jgi:hypothetical protein